MEEKLTENNNIDTSQEYERLWLQKLEEQNHILFDIAKGWFQGYKNSQQLSQIIVISQEWEKYFITFEPIAQKLNKDGRPHMLNRLNVILNDIRKSIQICQQMYQSAYNFEMGLIQINMKSQKEIFDIWQSSQRR